MAIYLDDQPVALPAADLGAVLDAATEQLRPSGRVLVEVYLQDKALSGEQIENMRRRALSDEDVRLYSADPRELAMTTLREVRDRLDEAGQAQLDAADLLQQDKAGAAMQRVSAAMEIWQQTQQAVLHSAMLTGVRLDEHTFEGQPVSAVTEALVQQLRQVRDLLAANDTVGLTDALNYEWPETVKCWQRLIDELIGWVEAKQ